jgi:phage terminase large subunit
MVVATELNIRTTKVYEAILQAMKDGKRRILLEGGTWSSKTYSALEALIILAQKAPEHLDISVVSESIPHLKQGCIRDFFNILDETTENNPFYNKTDHIYRRPGWNGVFQFFGADDDGKVRGPRRHILFINEGNNIPWETARGLDSRTEIFTIVDWNPTGEFWAHEFWMDEPNNAYNHSTYLDALEAGVISQQLVQDNIEIYRDKDPNWWNIYGLGLIGKIEGLVYPYFEQVDELPLGAYFYGLDYGFSVDPTVLVKNVILGDKLYSQQMFYDYSGLTNDQIARHFSLLHIKSEPIYPDPDEPKSAEELRKLGFNIQEAVKGKGSVAFGIQKVNQYYQSWTKDSVDCIKEQRNCRFIKDRQTGAFTDRITHQWSHGMDARRYPVATYLPSYQGQQKAVSNH